MDLWLIHSLPPRARCVQCGWCAVHLRKRLWHEQPVDTFVEDLGRVPRRFLERHLRSDAAAARSEAGGLLQEAQEELAGSDDAKSGGSVEQLGTDRFQVSNFVWNTMDS